MTYVPARLSGLKFTVITRNRPMQNSVIRVERRGVVIFEGPRWKWKEVSKTL